jgi:hypothetical protein
MRTLENTHEMNLDRSKDCGSPREDDRPRSPESNKWRPMMRDQHLIPFTNLSSAKRGRAGLLDESGHRKC